VTSWDVFDGDIYFIRFVMNQITLFLAGVFGIAAGASPNFVTFAALVACAGFGIGGKYVFDHLSKIQRF
jgi:hypothetical protein